jgi:serine/threonine-protein kinase
MAGPEVGPNVHIGRYRVENQLGEGGMAKVYRAYDTHQGVPVALKVLSEELSNHDGARARFKYEAKTMAGLKHPNIVRVFDIGEDHGRLWIAMELMSEGSVFDFMASQGPMKPDHAVNVLAGVLDALTMAHSRGITHRDIKPENILLGEVLSVKPIDMEGCTMWHVGMPKLTDFGIARVEERTHALTQTGSIMGTWAYMAPEQRVDATQVDGRTDLYACGVLLCAMLTGRTPHDLNSSEVREALGKFLPDRMAVIVRRSTRYHPEQRYQSAYEMKEHLLEMAKGMDTGSIPAAPARDLDGDQVTFSLDKWVAPPSQPEVVYRTPPKWVFALVALGGAAVWGVLTTLAGC